MLVRQKLILFCGFLIAGVVVGLVSLLFGLSTGATDALAGAALATLAVLGIPFAFGSFNQVKNIEVVKAHKAAFRAEDWSDVVPAPENEVELARHSRQTYRITSDPVVVCARGTAAAGSTASERVYKPLIVGS
jgi:hypothetical protein